MNNISNDRLKPLAGRTLIADILYRLDTSGKSDKEKLKIIITEIAKALNIMAKTFESALGSFAADTRRSDQDQFDAGKEAKNKESPPQAAGYLEESHISFYAASGGE